jgi:ferredoxin
MSKVRKISVYYFSGTGNAKQIALWISELANKQGIQCQLYNIAETELESIGSPDPEALVVIISPIHGFNYPKLVLTFIRHFPIGSNNIVLMNTRAGMKIGRFVTPGLTGVAFMLASVLLKRKGYRIKGQIPFDMPSNWISVHPALRGNAVNFICRKIHERVEKHCSIIFAGKPDFHAYRDLVQDILIAPVSLLYYVAGRFAFAKSYYASYDCNNCGLCIRQCPVQAIKTLNGRPFWTFSCESCMQCMNSCPEKAIETSHGLFLLISVLSSAILGYLLDRVLKSGIESGFLRFTIFTVIFFVLLWLVYRIQHIMLRNKFCAKLIGYASLTHYKFWGRYRLVSDERKNHQHNPP